MKLTIKIVMVGHIDHGKSTLIGRLLYETDSLPRGVVSEIRRISKELGKEAELAYLTDQLREEREKNITIDTAQIFFKTKKKDFVIIDAPGHVEFIKNMMTGAAHAEAAVLIVDAQEGVREQTRRHAYILKMLGIANVMAVLNKMDLVGYGRERFEGVKADLEGFFEELGVSPSHVIPISAREGDNISKRSPNLRWFKGPSFLGALETVESKAVMERPFRFPVQDVYEIDGERVIVGRVTSGAARQGQKVVLPVSGFEATIAAIKVFRKEKMEARAGESIGIVLREKPGIRRGDVVSSPEEPPVPTSFFRGNIFWLSDVPLETGTALTLRCATQELGCVVESVERRIDTSTLEVIAEDSRELRQNESGTVRVRSENPIIAENFNYIEELGRFVIEREHELQGAGIITEARLQ